MLRDARLGLECGSCLVSRPRRRDFLAVLAAASAYRPSPLEAADEFPVQFREVPPCADLRPLVRAENDIFRGERHGLEVERVLSSMIQNGGLPLATQIRGSSPMPDRYVEDGRVLHAVYASGAEDFAAGMTRWIEALGEVRRAEFRALPDDVVRFEVSSRGPASLEHRTGQWRMTWDGDYLAGFEPLSETVARSHAPLFEDATAELFGAVPEFSEHLGRGVPYWRSRLDSATGIGVYGNQGVSVGDIDGDGWDELYVCQPAGLPNRLYSRRDGSWVDVTAEAGVGLLDDTSHALFLDLRNSGLQDLIVLTSGGPLLFLNDGTGRFRRRDNAFQFANKAQGTFAGMAAADFDGDGKVDLYLCSYLYFQSEDQYRYPAPYHDARNGPPNFLFRNELGDDGEGFLRDVTVEAGFGHNNDRYSFAAAWCDYDEDGHPELYVANDFGRNNLYKYVQGSFRDIAEEAGLHDVGPGMSAAWFDYDRDGSLDLYVTNMWTATGQRVVRDQAFKPAEEGVPRSQYHGHTKGNSLYRNRGDGSFEYAGAVEAVEMGRWSWSGDGFDFDLDGTPEILVTAGMITHSRERDKDLGSFFWRQVVANSPADARPSPDYETGWNCLNQLVREDYSWNGNEPNVYYVREGGVYRDFSGVSGLDRALDSRAFAVTDFDGDGRLDLFLKSRLGPQLLAFRNQASKGRQPMVIELEGTRSNRDGIGAVVRVETEGGTSAQVVSAGSGYISQHTKKLHFGLGDQTRARQVTVTWPSGETQVFDDLDVGYRYRVREGDLNLERALLGSPTRLRSSPHRITSDNSLVFEPTWLVDPLQLPEPAEDGFLLLVQGETPEFPADIPHQVVDLASGPAGRAAAFSIFRRYLFDYRTGLAPPIAFLVALKGKVFKVYPSIPEAAVARADLELVQGRGTHPPALPFDGQYHAAYPRRNHFRMGSAYMQAGHPAIASTYLREAATSENGRENFKVWLTLGQAELQVGNVDRAERDLSHASNLRPDSPQVWNNLGGVAMAREDFVAALKHFRRALELNEDLTYALVNAAQAHVRLGNPIDAERLLQRALDLDPNDAEAANKLGLIWARQGRLGEARALFQRAIESQRNHAEAINNLAVLYLQSTQVDDAIAAFRYGIEQIPDFDSFYMNLARVHADRGDYARSRQVLQQLLERKPGHTAARRVLIQLQGR